MSHNVIFHDILLLVEEIMLIRSLKYFNDGISCEKRWKGRRIIKNKWWAIQDLNL
jgi:hypothetical protein